MDSTIIFTNVDFNLAKNISSPDKDVSIYDYLGEGRNGSMFVSPVDEQEIIRTLQQFKNKVSPDFTDINMSRKFSTQLIMMYWQIFFYLYGVDGIAHKWIVSYLENRSQFVQYKNCDSEVLMVWCGVPQGSILGPKLFIMFINDIVNASKLFKFILFANDMNMFYCNNDINELIRQTNAELDKLNVWFSVNRLSLNIAKTSYMIFGNCALKTSLFIKINKFTINRVEAATF